METAAEWDRGGRELGMNRGNTWEWNFPESEFQALSPGHRRCLISACWKKKCVCLRAFPNLSASGWRQWTVYCEADARRMLSSHLLCSFKFTGKIRTWESQDEAFSVMVKYQAAVWDHRDVHVSFFLTAAMSVSWEAGQEDSRNCKLGCVIDELRTQNICSMQPVNSYQHCMVHLKSAQRVLLLFSPHK